MLTCPVCRSQNTESAKFCGNCGHPFPRPAEPVSSLVNCTQGHIYSAVYNHCPYCPQPPIVHAAPTVKDSDTVFEPPAGGNTFQNPRSYETSFGDEPSIIAENRHAESERWPNAETGPENRSEGSANDAGLENLSADIRSGSLPRGVESLSSNGSRPHDQVYRNGSRPISSRLALTRPPIAESNQPTHYEPGQSSQGRSVPDLASPHLASGPVRSEASEPDRRTTVVAREVGAGFGSRGKIVGWLISYTSNPDGDDYRICAGHNRIGANSICDIVINDDTVSGSHAILVYREGRCLIKDDLSRNGTFVNGREITEAHPLQNYDQIRLGNTYLIFVSAQRI